MKKIFNILAAFAVLFSAAACQITQEDAFSTDPAAPVMNDHNDILVTNGTDAEDVTFSWAAYRNLPEGLKYTLTVSYLGTDAAIGTTDGLYLTMSKTDFQTKLYSLFPDLPVNDTFSLTFKVSVANDGKTYTSDPISINVYANGNAVGAAIATQPSDIVLDATAPTASLTLLSWTPARLVYGETVTYDVVISVLDAEGKVIGTKTLAEGLSATEYAITVDELNEAIAAAGGTEAAKNTVTYSVVAKCNSLPNGVSTVSNSVSVTTYLATFPTTLYLPGNYQSWDPATAPTITQSTAKKGFYEAVINVTTTDGSDAQFKFSPNPAWKDDFGGTVTVDKTAGGYAHAKGTVGTSDNVTVPSGVYNLALNKKLGTVELVQINTLSLIGSAVGDFNWGKDVDMVYDATAKTFTVAKTALKAGDFKIRFNHDWTYSMGGTLNNVSSTDGSNIAVTVSGDYKIILNVGTCPYTIKLINTNFPDKIYTPGSHQSWSPSTSASLAGNGEGLYEGFLTLGDQFKFTSSPDWDHTAWGGTAATAADGTVTVALDPAGGNITPAAGYYKAVVDLSTLAATLTPVTTVGIIGGFDGNSWASDAYPMTYDAASDTWTAKNVKLLKATAWKFRMNGGWTINLGGDLTNLTNDGANITGIENGLYDVTLSIGTTPYKATLKKVGDVAAPSLPESMYIIGDAINGWSDFVPMVKFNSQDGMFWIIRYLEAGKSFKFSPKAAWEGDFASLDSNTGFSVVSNNCQVAANGVYAIGVDFGGSKIVVEKAKVYGIGDAFGGWTAEMSSALYQESGKTLTVTATAAGNMRSYVASSILSASGDWWHAEFILKDGKIVYRADGGDPDAVPLTAGKKITLDFNAGTGTIE